MKDPTLPRSALDACVFCRIVDGSEPASVIFEDDDIMSFMTIRPTRPGECLIIPKIHIDHFTDLDDHLSVKIMLLAQKLGSRIHELFQPQKIGMVVHGYGVHHAHLILVPQHDAYDITSARFAYLDGGEIRFDSTRLPKEDRKTLNEQANMLRIDQAEV